MIDELSEALRQGLRCQCLPVGRNIKSVEHVRDKKGSAWNRCSVDECLVQLRDVHRRAEHNFDLTFHVGR